MFCIISLCVTVYTSLCIVIKELPITITAGTVIQGIAHSKYLGPGVLIASNKEVNTLLRQGTYHVGIRGDNDSRKWQILHFQEEDI